MKTSDRYTFDHMPYIAYLICEGIEEAKSDEEFVAAWQYIYDSGMYRRLANYYPRRIRDMIREGIIDA